jgi:hypothetical protein
MKNWIKLTILLLNFGMLKFASYNYLDVFIIYVILLNILSLTVFIYFEKKIDKPESLLLPGAFKPILIDNFKNPFNLMLIFMPLIFLIFEGETTMNPIFWFIYYIIALNLTFNIVICSYLIKAFFQQYYFIYIMITGIVFQLLNYFWYNNNIEDVFLVSILFLFAFYSVFTGIIYTKKISY